MYEADGHIGSSLNSAPNWPVQVSLSRSWYTALAFWPNPSSSSNHSCPRLISSVLVRRYLILFDTLWPDIKEADSTAESWSHLNRFSKFFLRCMEREEKFQRNQICVKFHYHTRSVYCRSTFRKLKVRSLSSMRAWSGAPASFRLHPARRSLQSPPSPVVVILIAIVIRRTRLSTVGDRMFPVTGSLLWNSPPPELQRSLFLWGRGWNRLNI